MTPGEALTGFLGALGVKRDAVPSDEERASALYRSLLADKRVLVVLDNARDAAQVRPLLPSTGGSVTIVTSRHRLSVLTALHDAHPVTVGSLPEAESLRLLAGLVGSERTSAEPEAARQLVQLCAGLPLALRIAAANVVDRPRHRLAEVVSELSLDRLGRLAVDGDPTAAVAATFDLSYGAIDPEEERLYLRLAFLPLLDLSRDLVVAVSEQPEPVTDRLLSRLEAAHRLEHYRPGRYRFHDLVREYARRKAAEAFDEATRQQIRVRVADWYSIQRPAPAAEYGNLAAAYRDWVEYPTVSRLANALFHLARDGYHLAEMSELADVGMEVGARSGDPLDFARPCNLKVMVSYLSGDLVTSAEYGQKLVDAVGRTPEGDITGAARGNLGITLRQLGRFDESATLLEEALQAAEDNGDQGNLVGCLSSLGEINNCLGRFDEAERHLTRAVQLNDELPGGPRSDSVLSLGELYLDMGRVTTATGLYVRAVEILERFPSHIDRIRLQLGQARLHRLAGRYDAARDILTQGLELAREINAWRFVFVLQYELAELLVDAGEPAAAAGMVDRYAGGADRHHTPETLAIRAGALCKIHIGLGDHDRAIGYGRQACEMFAAMPDPLRYGRSLEGLAGAYAAAGDEPAAAEARREAQNNSPAAMPEGVRALRRLRTLEG